MSLFHDTFVVGTLLNDAGDRGDFAGSPATETRGRR